MKKCKKCGFEVKDDAVFCTSCGTKLENTEEKSENKDMKEIEKKKFNGKMLIPIILGLAVVMIITAFVINKKKTIKLSDYYEVTYEGGDGFGKAVVDLKYDELGAKVCEINDISIDSIEYYGVMDTLMGDYITVKATPNEELSNGDKIAIEFDIPSKEFIKGVKLTDSSDKVKVEGLEKYKEITDKDLFKDIELIYTNYSPYLEVEVENKSNDPFLQSVTYSVQNSGEIANGDTITIEAQWGEESADANKCIVSGSGKKDVKVEGQAEYILSKDMLTDDMIEQIKVQIEKDYKEKEASWNSDNYKFYEISDICLVDNTNNYGPYNIIQVSIELHSDKTYFYNGCYKNVSIRDGEIFFGKLEGNSWNVFYTEDSYNNDIEDYKARAKATFNLME